MEGKGSWVHGRLVAGVIGVFAGGITIMLVESAGHALFGTADPGDLSSVTLPMFLSVLVAWIVGSGVAGALSTWWARASSAGLGTVLGLILLAGAVSTMMAIPHPGWMMVAAVVLMPVTALLAARTVARSGTVTT